MELLTGSRESVSLEEAYARCVRLARTHYENFTVGSRFLPRKLLPHFGAVYAFCRTVDDLGDEAPGDRLKLLDLWQEELERCYGGVPQSPYLVALQRTIETFDIPREPFLKLIEELKDDQEGIRIAAARVLGRIGPSARAAGPTLIDLLSRQYGEQERGATGPPQSAEEITKAMLGRGPYQMQRPRNALGFLCRCGARANWRSHGRSRIGYGAGR